MVREFEFKARKKQKEDRNEEDHAAGRGEFVHHRPEKLEGDAERALPGGKLVDLVPVEVFAVEAVARAGVGSELGPEDVEVAAFADPLPEGAQARGGSRTGRGGRTHGQSIGDSGAESSGE